ncbi:zinc ribbon domain-containing protein [Oryzomonas japonica]|uniref:Zinc ribbon domain-containing protein n=1 Tax=Oryzomonas japonica TaxID=2603858 RepID=A0A7J4ZPD8_9BACT|nr:zinc ribbon domain-containing protein [Oryzomonas japonica]
MRTTAMPIYEYRCEACGTIFSVKMSMADHEQGPRVCPTCKGSNVLPHYTTFYAKTSKKS